MVLYLPGCPTSLRLNSNSTYGKYIIHLQKQKDKISHHIPSVIILPAERFPVYWINLQNEILVFSGSRWNMNRRRAGMRGVAEKDDLEYKLAEGWRNGIVCNIEIGKNVSFVSKDIRLYMMIRRCRIGRTNNIIRRVEKWSTRRKNNIPGFLVDLVTYLAFPFLSFISSTPFPYTIHILFLLLITLDYTHNVVYIYICYTQN